MAEAARQGPSAIRGVSDGDRAEIEALIARCAHADGGDPKIAVPSPSLGADSVDCAFFFHEDDALIGYFAFDGSEISGVVDPAQRRRGIGRTLLTAALEVARRQGLATLTLITEERCEAGLAFARDAGAKKAFSEHRMVLGELLPGPPALPGFTLRAADLGDLDELVRLMEQIFDEPAAPVRVALRRELTTPGERFYLARIGELAVGCFKAVFAGPRVFLYAFGVVPAWRRLGLGWTMLAQAKAALCSEAGCSLGLEVETHNLGAIALYRAAGFRITTTYGYHALVVPG